MPGRRLAGPTANRVWTVQGCPYGQLADLSSGQTSDETASRTGAMRAVHRGQSLRSSPSLCIPVEEVR